MIIFIGALILNAGSPGPGIAALVSCVTTNGWRDIFPFVAAMWIGEVIWFTVAVAGFTSLAQTFEFGFSLPIKLGDSFKHFARCAFQIVSAHLR